MIVYAITSIEDIAVIKREKPKQRWKWLDKTKDILLAKSKAAECGRLGRLQWP